MSTYDELGAEDVAAHGGAAFSGLSAEEQVLALESLHSGTLAVLRLAIKYVREYHELVEEDLGDRPDLAGYLRRARDVLSRSELWSRKLEQHTTTAAELEELDLDVLLSGVVARCRSVVDSEDRLRLVPSEGGRLAVRGALFQLQDLFVRLLTMRLAAGATLTVAARRQALDASFLRSMRSECGAGAYVIASVSRGEPFTTQAAEPFLDAFVNGRFTEVLRETEQGEIGLLPLYGVVRLHGGDVFVNRDGDEVVAIGIALPAARGREEMQAPRNLAGTAPEGTETILLVDDEDMIWDVIIDMLQGLGYSVILAANGREAGEVYAANADSIDLVLLDMVMPEMTGSEAFYRLRDMDPDVKVLLSSGYVGEGEAQSLLRDGALGFLEKPYSVEQLARRMRDILDLEPAA